MIQKFTILRSTASTKGGFINALSGTTTKKELGVTKTTTHIVNIKTDAAVEVGSEHEIELNDYEIKTYANEFVDPKTGELRHGENKWLQAKLG